MKKIILIALCLFSFIYMGSCTNNEGSNDLDVITPEDTAQSVTASQS
jgi:hypothetical protein